MTGSFHCLSFWGLAQGVSGPLALPLVCDVPFFGIPRYLKDSVCLRVSVSGRAADFEWSATTDPRGHARVEIAGEGSGGYYRARAILGEFSFNADGDAVYDPIVLIVRDGKFEIFE